MLGTAELAAEPLPTLNTFIGESLQIDQLGEQPAPEDANLFLGSDPADASASIDKPLGGPATFIDWEDLGGDLANHRLLDLDLASGKDPSSFPRSNECVAASQVLSKMDLRYIATANNHEYAYFAVLRQDNNGDAGYYWLFTRKEPKLIAGEAPCKSTELRLVYDISGPGEDGAAGDVLIGGHFKPNGSPLVDVYRATQDALHVSAVAAIDYTSPLWAKDPAGAAAVAVNTSLTAPGAFGAAGASLSGGKLLPELFAEAAVPISVFTGGSACGATFYGSVITRPSGSGGTSPDLKDLAGPALFNFGSVEAEAWLTPRCSSQAGYEVSVTGPDGEPLADPFCEWEFSDGTIVTDSCSGVVDLPVGTHTATVTVADLDSSCSGTFDAAAVKVCAPLSVSAALTATCSSSFGFEAVPGGGCGESVSFEWAFSGPGSTTPSSSDAASGSVVVGTPGGSYSGLVEVTDGRTDISCSASASDSAIPYAPLSVSLALEAAAESCPGMASDAASYAAVAGGGNGSYTYNWIGPACAGSSCTVDPTDGDFCASQSVQVELSDSSGLCSPVLSEVELYEKVTLVTASDV